MDKASLIKNANTIVKLTDWGYPGYLTEEEFAIFDKFRDDVYSKRRDDNYRSTVFSFEKANEEKPYALCRWLRARKYNLQDTVKMVEEASECTADVRKEDFFPNASKALSVESSLYIKQYPQLYYGHALNGCPVFISQPGMLNIDAIGCLTSLPNIINYHWHAMMHEYAKKLHEECISSNGKFKRYECVCILDLAKLTASKLGKRELNLVKVQAAIDSLCFPETLNKMVIVNAPGFFTFSWKLIRGWIDQRTAAKVEVIGSNKDKLLKKLSTFIDPKNLPSDYGGSGIGINDFLNDAMLEMGERRREIGSTLKLQKEDSKMVSFKSSHIESIVVGKNQFVKLSFITRTLVGCNIIVEESKSGKVLATIDAIHDGNGEDDENELPSRYDLDDSGVVLKGDGAFNVKMVSKHGNRKKIITVMLVVKTFIRDETKVSSDKPQSVDDTNNVSICTGVFSPSDDKKLIVTASPGRRRKQLFMEERPSVDETSTSNGVPDVKRMTDTSSNSSASTPTMIEGLENENSFSSSDKFEVVADSPQRVSCKSLCGMLPNACK